MTNAEFTNFTNYVLLICAVLVVFNLLRVRARGMSAYLLAAALLVFGGTVYLYRSGAAQALVWTGGIIVFLLLVADMLYRQSRPSRPKRP